jgi:hypothetical protein
MPRPARVNRALVLLWAALAIAGISVFASFREVAEVGFYPGIVIVAIITFGANAALIWLIGRRQNWARIVLLVLVLAMLPLLFFMGSGDDAPNLVEVLADWGSSVLELIAMYLLFTGDSPPWFRGPMERTAGARSGSTD